MLTILHAHIFLQIFTLSSLHFLEPRTQSSEPRFKPTGSTLHCLFSSFSKSSPVEMMSKPNPNLTKMHPIPSLALRNTPIPVRFLRSVDKPESIIYNNRNHAVISRIVPKALRELYTRKFCIF